MPSFKVDISLSTPFLPMRFSILWKRNKAKVVWWLLNLIWREILTIWNGVSFFKVLSCLGFNSKWIQMIDQCISMVSFAILLEGSPFEKVTPIWGLRQGDHLSSFHFILGTEALSKLLIKEDLAGNLHGIKISRNSPLVSYLLFVDDLMVFSKGTANEASCIMSCISNFSSWSGQQVNLDKSSLFLSKNSSIATTSSIQAILNLHLIPSTTKHLGLPLFFHKNKNLAFEDLKNKILNRILGWKAKLFSQAARTTLIRTMANSLLVFVKIFTLVLEIFGGEFLLIRSKAYICLVGKKKKLFSQQCGRSRP